MTHEAKCQCGQLSLTCEGEPDFVLVCNCVQCQRRSGSAFAIGAFFRREKTNLSGTHKKWSRLGSSGQPLINHFCPDCGTNLFWAPQVRPDHYGVAAGCLTSAVKEPETVIWMSEKLPWLVFPEPWVKHEKGIVKS